MKKIIGGEEVEIDGGVLKIRIKEPYYFAYKKYGYRESISFGINFKILNYCQTNGLTLQVECNGRKYVCNVNKVLEFIGEHNSIMKIKDANLGVVSAEIFKVVGYEWDKAGQKVQEVQKA